MVNLLTQHFMGYGLWSARRNLKINKCEDRTQLQQWKCIEASDLFSVCTEGWFHSFIYIFVVMSHRTWVSGWGYFLYIEKEKKNWEINQTLFTVFNLKVVLELFHLLFCSSEVLLLLVPSPSGEALMKNGNQHVFFFMHITVPFFCLHLFLYFPFFSLLSLFSLFFHPYSHFIF